MRAGRRHFAPSRITEFRGATSIAWSLPPPKPPAKYLPIEHPRPSTMDSLNDLFSLRGHVGIVTGASSGLGVECAHALALAGADVVLVARRGDRCEKLADELAKRYNVRALGIGADVAIEADIDRV